MSFKFQGLTSRISQCFTTQFTGTENLTVKEKEIIQHAVSTRQNDFSTGRYCARVTLEKLGFPATEILTGTGKEPLWPEGITGSISHSKKLVGAVSAFTADIISIGIDIEAIGGVPEEIYRMLFTEKEHAFLNSLSLNDKALYATLLFSFKESFYKMQYPLTYQFVDFIDVEITFKDELFTLTVIKLLEKKIPFLERLKMEYDVFNDQAICICYLHG